MLRPPTRPARPSPWLLTAVIVCAAPPTRAASLTLEDAIRLAADRSDAVAVATTDVERAHVDRRRALSEWLPQVNASVSYDRTLATEFENVLLPPAGGQDSLFSDLPFGRENNWKAGFSVVQSVYAGGRTQARLALARHAQTAARGSVQSARAQAVLTVVQAYFDALLVSRMLQIAEEQLRLAAATLEHVQAARAEQTRAPFDVLRAQVSVANQRPLVLERRAQWEVAQRNLRQLLDLSPDTPFELTTPLDLPLEQLPDPGPLARQAVGVIDDGARIPVVQAAAAAAARAVAVGMAWSQHMPRIDATMNYQLVNYPEKIAPDFDDVRRNWTVGLVVQVPVFAGFRVFADVDGARADEAEANARLRQARDLAQLDAEDAERSLHTALEALEATRGTVELARQALGIADLRYREGLSTHLEWEDAQLSLAQAQASSARAIRDVQVARVRRALLPALPLPSSPGSTVGPGGAATATTASPASSSVSSVGGTGAAVSAPAPAGATQGGSMSAVQGTARP